MTKENHSALYSYVIQIAFLSVQLVEMSVYQTWTSKCNN